MSGEYFTKDRNVELSTLYYLEQQFPDDWSGVTIVKTFKNAYAKSTAVPIVCVSLIDTNNTRLEIGSNTLEERYLIAIDIFARSAGQRLDLAAYIKGLLKTGWVHYCYDDKTEVLTEQGWKFFKDVTYKDEIATLNPSNQEIEYHKPENIYKYHHEGEMYSVKNMYVDMCVTPNHKMLVYDVRKCFSKGLIEANKLFNKTYRLLKIANWKGKQKDYFMLPEHKTIYDVKSYVKKTGKKVDSCKSFKNFKERRIPMKLWLEFFGYWLSEGCTYKYYVQVSQSDKNYDKKNKIRDCLDAMNFHYYETPEYFRISDSQLSNYLKKFGKSLDKFIPREFMSLDKSYLEILFNALVLGDGSINKKGKGLKYASISHKLASNVQELAIKCGYSSDVSIEKRELNDIYLVLCRKIKGQYPRVNDRKINQDKWIQYKGDIFCINVPNHIVLVRRNGKSVFSGNSFSHTSGDKSTLTRTANGRDYVTDWLTDARIDITGGEEQKDKFRHNISVRVRKNS